MDIFNTPEGKKFLEAYKVTRQTIPNEKRWKLAEERLNGLPLSVKKEEKAQGIPLSVVTLNKK